MSPHFTDRAAIVLVNSPEVVLRALSFQCEWTFTDLSCRFLYGWISVEASSRWHKISVLIWPTFLYVAFCVILMVLAYCDGNTQTFGNLREAALTRPVENELQDLD
ncbi:hypothetical protein RRG08_004185 [Elysia crispata]|uniref:Uncharacterized protein n=1 Tax=Elysia crispata TaxID=231223 RepID=A0AAE0YWS9_9GAST|nr:hypothetical protein RRG08_004185 [Elysia crispata]